jgi:hypothetical protein
VEGEQSAKLLLAVSSNALGRIGKKITIGSERQRRYRNLITRISNDLADLTGESLCLLGVVTIFVMSFFRSTAPSLTLGYPLRWWLQFVGMNSAFSVYVTIPTSVGPMNPKKRTDFLFPSVFRALVGDVAEQVCYFHET